MKHIFQQAKRLFSKRTFAHLRPNISRIYTKRVFGILCTTCVGYAIYHRTTSNSMMVFAYDDGEHITDYKFPTKFLKQARKDMIGVVLVACGSFNPPTYLHLRLFGILLCGITYHSCRRSKRYSRKRKRL
jgi:hypothetical protein